MSQEDANKTMIRRYYEEVWGQKQLDVVDELFAPDYVLVNIMPWRKPGAAGLKEFIADNHRMFPDIQYVINWMIAEGNTVAVHVTATATHKGDLVGPVGPVAATGRLFSGVWRAFFT